MTPTTHITELSKNPTSFHIYYLLEDTPQDIHKLLTVKAREEEFTEKKDQLLHLEQIASGNMTHTVVVGLGDEKEKKERIIRDQTMKAVQLARTYKQKTITVHIGKNSTYLQHVVEGVILGDYSLDRFKSKEHVKKNPHITDVYIVTEQNDANQKAIEKGKAAAEASILTRDLVNIPGSHVFPETLAQHARAIEKKSQGKVTVQVLGEEECKKLGMGSFLSVGQGSDKKSAFIILHYKGTGDKKFTFVGKSITFDSGGLSLKPSEHMMDMKTDMAGGATVLGVFDYLATAQPSLSSFSDVYGILPAAENMISGSATRPGDVITAMNGKTIEVLNTDAEGRLVLADALVYADTVLKSDYIIDIATLTGACAVALGNDLAGVFTNEDLLEKKFGSAAIMAGDDYWRMPLHAAYSSLIKSTIADIKNIGGGRYGGAITAALFLKEFVKKAKWMHIDIAGPAHSEKKGASGWGVLSVIYFLEQITNL